MATKKPKRSSITDLMLVPVDRRRRRRIQVYVGLLLVLLPLLAFFGGEIFANYSRTSQQDQTVVLRAKVVALEKDLQGARDELALQRADTEVTSQAQEQVRVEIKDLRDQIAELEEAVAFYKNVMAPGSGENGLKIEKIDVASTTTPNVYGFRLVLTQVGDNRGYLSGSVTVIVSGRQGEETVRLNGSEVLAEGTETRFRFRYFQELTGRVTLPEGFEADKVTIEAVSTGRRQEKIERSFIWQVQERNSAWAG